MLRNRKQTGTVQTSKEQTHISKEKYQLLSKCHNSNIGRWGVLRTMKNVRKMQSNDPKCKVPTDEYTEVELRHHVIQFLRKCPCCQKMSQLKPYIHTYKYVTMKGGIMENLAMDAIVGLPRLAEGNNIS